MKIRVRFFHNNGNWKSAWHFEGIILTPDRTGGKYFQSLRDKIGGDYSTLPELTNLPQKNENKECQPKKEKKEEGMISKFKKLFK